jgi:RNA polymerase primary sigma factor
VIKLQSEPKGLDALGRYLREIRRIPLLTREQEIDLATRAKTGDQKALDELVRHNLRFVVSVAKQYSKSGVPFEDLVNEGNLGLIRGAKRFDVDRGFRFISYAVWWIRQAILQYLGEHGRTVRLPLNKSAVLNRITRESQRLGQELGRDPSSDEIAKRIGLTPLAVDQALEMPTKHYSLDDAAEGKEGDFFADTLSDEITPTPEDSVYEATRNDDIAAAIASLNEREQDILNRYFGLEGNAPHTLEEIGQVYHLTRERVRQIRDRALVRLRNSPFTAVLSEYAQN